MNTKIKKVTTKPSQKYNYNRQIDIATQTLERNMSLISNCDTKTSIVLTTIGGLLAIILTSDGFSTIYDIVVKCINEKSFCNVLYLSFLVGTICVLSVGLWNLVSALVARVDCKSVTDINLQSDSNIFFAGICRNPDYFTYEKKFIGMNESELLKQLIKEIYINSKIASAKYHKYNIGLKLSIIGFVFFIFVLLIGIYLY